MSKIAVIKTGGKQYKVQENDILKVEKLEAEEGKDVTFDNVLLVSEEDGSSLEIGKPQVEKKVTAKVLEQGRGKKVTVRPFKSKVRYSGKYGHRQPFTKVQITKIG